MIPWKGKFTIPKDKAKEYDGTHTISIFAKAEDGSELDEDENLLIYNPGTDILHKITIDLTPPKLAYLKILQGTKRIENNNIVIDGPVRYYKDYETNQVITNKPIVVGSFTGCFFLVKFNEELDRDVPLNVSFTLRTP